MAFALSTFSLSSQTHNRAKKGQDFSLSGKGKDNHGYFQYILIADGHGYGYYSKILSSESFTWKTVVCCNTEEEMSHELQRQIKILAPDTDFTNDGSTLSIVKVYNLDSVIKCYWIGDSQIRVFKDGKLVFKSKNHNGTNKKELMRLTKEKEKHNLDYKIKKVASICLDNADTIKMKKYLQFHFNKNKRCEKMLITRAIGHNNKLFPVFQTKTITQKSMDFSVIVASDGFWDMYCNDNEDDVQLLLKQDSQFLVKYALTRWNQKWNYKQKNITKQIILPPESHDDISVAVIRSC